MDKSYGQCSHTTSGSVCYLPGMVCQHPKKPMASISVELNWAWWRTQEVPKANPAIPPYVLARKYLRGTQQMLEILQDLYDVIDTLKEGATYIPNDDVSLQGRGLGTMVSFWERMRSVCPKVNSDCGPILNRNKRPCVTLYSS